MRKIILWAKTAKLDALTVYFATRDPRTPRSLCLLALLVMAYALSPVDILPDIVPIAGYIDDVLLVPLGLRFIGRLLPAPVRASSRQKATTLLQGPRVYFIAAGFVLIWLAGLVALAFLIF